MKIKKGYILPSAAFTVPASQIKRYKTPKSAPKAGDVMFGEVVKLGQHKSLENKFGRIHNLHIGSKAVFVYGNRYAPDMYEGVVPGEAQNVVDMLARSGLIGTVRTQHSLMISPTRVKILGQVCNDNEHPINTRMFQLIKPKLTEKKLPRSKLVLVVGTSMNSGKSMAAAACVYSLATSGFKVRGSKITGTASLKDILHMNDAGANPISDFSYFGFPSTYLVKKEDLLGIFNDTDLKFANNPDNYWVVEFADGIIQRETAMLLGSEDVKSRIHKLVFCANDAFGAIGGIQILKEQFGLTPDAISGICSNSPLHMQEIKEFTDIPIVNSANVNVKQMMRILAG